MQNAAPPGVCCNRACPDQGCRVVGLRETALALAKKLADKPLGSLCATKRLMRETEAVQAAAERERGVFEERLLSKEAGEAFKAFAEKRQPDFRKVG